MAKAKSKAKSKAVAKVGKTSVAKKRTKAVGKARVRRGDMLKTAGERDYRCYIKIGSKGSGKSTDARDDIDDYFELFTPAYKGVCHPRCFVHDYSRSRAFREDIMTVKEYVQRLEHAWGQRIYIPHPFGIRRSKTKEVVKVRLVDWPEEILGLKNGEGKMIWDGSEVSCLRSTTTNPKIIKRLHNLVFEHLTNALVIWDECSVYFKANPPQWQREILINHRNKGLEVIYMFHKLMLVPIFFSSSDLIHSITLFKTGEKTLKYPKLERYACQDDLWDAYLEVKDAPKLPTRAQFNKTVIV